MNSCRYSTACYVGLSKLGNHSDVTTGSYCILAHSLISRSNGKSSERVHQLPIIQFVQLPVGGLHCAVLGAQAEQWTPGGV